jgi:CelD/BcsL family acetyltransferase involved in cellulose biosynthesis
MIDAVDINSQTDPRWLSYLESHPDATVFHHPNWISTLQETYGFTQRSVGVVRDGSICGILPLLEIRSWLTGHRAVCLPFSDFCAPLADDSEAAVAMLKRVQSLSLEYGWKFVEVRGTVAATEEQTNASYRGHTLVLDQDTDKLFRSFKKSRIQQSVNKARSDGVVAEIRTDRRALEEFVQLNALTRKKHGLPPQSDHFFDRLYANLIASKMGFISTAVYDGHIIAAALYLHFKGIVVYKYAASDALYLRHCPNHLVMWEAIQHVAEKGFQRIDFGRTDLDHQGLLDFKRGWGTEESELTYHQIGGDVRSESLPRLRGYLKPVMTRMPIPLLKLVGKTLYSHTA